MRRVLPCAPCSTRHAARLGDRGRADSPFSCCIQYGISHRRIKNAGHMRNAEAPAQLRASARSARIIQAPRETKSSLSTKSPDAHDTARNPRHRMKARKPADTQRRTARAAADGA